MDVTVGITGQYLFAIHTICDANVAHSKLEVKCVHGVT